MNLEVVLREEEAFLAAVEIEPVDPCLWRQVYLDNVGGVGTSFVDSPAVPCAVCPGYDLVKDCYVDACYRKV